MIFSMILAASTHLHLIHIPRAVGRINITKDDTSSLNGIFKSEPVNVDPKIVNTIIGEIYCQENTHGKYPEWHEAEGQNCAHEGHGDGHVDVTVQEESPEVGPSSSRTAAQHEQSQSEMEIICNSLEHQYL